MSHTLVAMVAVLLEKLFCVLLADAEETDVFDREYFLCYVAAPCSDDQIEKNGMGGARSRSVHRVLVRET